MKIDSVLKVDSIQIGLCLLRWKCEEQMEKEQKGSIIPFFGINVEMMSIRPQASRATRSSRFVSFNSFGQVEDVCSIRFDLSSFHHFVLLFKLALFHHHSPKDKIPPFSTNALGIRNEANLESCFVTFVCGKLDTQRQDCNKLLWFSSGSRVG